jgi:transposase
MNVVIGVDIHKRESQACVIDEDGDVVEEKRFKTTPEGFAKALSKYGPSPVVIEAVGFHRPVAKWLTEQGHELHLAHARDLEKPKVKTDKIDAEHLAQLLRADLLPEAWYAPESIQKLRDLARHRQFLGQQYGRLKGKVKHDLYKHGHFVEDNPAATRGGRREIVKLQLPEITSTVQLLEAIQREMHAMDQLIAKVTTNDPSAELLMTIPGVGAFTALVILAEVGDFNRFPTADKLASYAGLSIRMEQSGDSEWKGHITRHGNALLRWMLVEMARNHIKYAPTSAISRKYAKMVKPKGSQRAAVAAARKLLHVMHAMMRTKTPFQVNRA